MSAVLINDTTMTSIAEAIRSKDGSSAKMLPSEMAGKIKNISTGIEIPNPIVVGETPIFVARLNRHNIGNYVTDLIGVTIKQSGTYKFSIHMMSIANGGSASLYKNGQNTSKLSSSGWTYVTLECNEGDRISINGGSSSNSVGIDCFIASIKWDTDFTSQVVTSEVKSASTRSSSMTASNVFVNIPKTATYKFIFSAATGGIVKDNRYVAQLYKNGTAISGATAVWRVDGSKVAAYVGNIACSKGDRIEIYFHSYDSNSLQVTELTAEEINN